MSYGIDSDIFGLGQPVQSVSKSGPNPSEAQAQDENGDVAASTIYDTSAGDAVSVTYAGSIGDTAGAIDLSGIKGGKVINGYVVTGMGVTTSNTDYPQIVISGQKTSTVDGDIAKYTHGITLNAGKGAQAFGATAGGTSRLTGSSASFAVQVARVMDSTGEEAAIDVYGGRVDATNTLVGVTGAPSATADTGFTLLGGPSEEESNTGYATGTVNLFKNITADT